MTRSILAGVAGLLLAAVASPGSAADSGSDDIYPHALLETHPALAAQYRTLVQPIAADHAWVRAGNGTETPVSRVSFDGHDYAVLSSCKPHDCPGETVVALMQSGATQAVGALVVNRGDNGLGPTRSTLIWLGDPDRDQRRFMAAYLFR